MLNSKRLSHLVKVCSLILISLYWLTYPILFTNPIHQLDFLLVPIIYSEKFTVPLQNNCLTMNPNIHRPRKRDKIYGYEKDSILLIERKHFVCLYVLQLNTRCC